MSIKFTHILKDFAYNEAEALIGNALWKIMNDFKWYEYYPYRMNFLSYVTQQHPFYVKTTPERMRIIIIDIVARHIDQTGKKKTLKKFMREVEEFIDFDDGLRLRETTKHRYIFFPTAWNGTWVDLYDEKFIGQAG